MSKDGMLINIGKINELLFDEYFCVPPYNSINGQWVSECFDKINAIELAKKVGSEMQNADCLKHHGLMRPYRSLSPVYFA